MHSTPVFSRIPALRVLVPFVLGIIAQHWWHSLWYPLILLVMATGSYTTIYFWAKSPRRRMSSRPFLTVSLLMAALSIGWLAAIIHCPPRIEANDRSGRVMTGKVASIEYTDFSMRLMVDVTSREMARCRVLLSTRGCDYTMSAGNLVAWDANLIEVKNLGNPCEMDYASHLLNNDGIRYQQHLPVTQLKIVGHSPSFLDRLATVRHHVAILVYGSTLMPSAQQLVNALLLGYSGNVDKDTRMEFSMAGISHVLALSGLHVGIIALVIWWLLFPLDYLRLKKLRLIITYCAIGLFAAFTGLSPSVLRAAIMIGFGFAAVMFYRRSSPLNALCMAALLILVFSPSSLYSVGFQLSFITVASILLFGRLPARVKSKYKAVNYLVSTIGISLVTMVATVSLTAHYFHVIPFMSVVTNLLVLPVLPLFMVMGAFFILALAAGVSCTPVVVCINLMDTYIHWVVGKIGGLPYSHMSGVDVSSFATIGYLLIVACLVMWIYHRRYRYFLAASCVVIAVLAHAIAIQHATPCRGLVIFNSFSSTPILYFDKGMGYLWVPDDDEIDLPMFKRYFGGFLARYRINDVSLVNNDTTLNLDGAMFKPPFAFLCGKRLMAIATDKWPHKFNDEKININFLVATKRFHGHASKLRELIDFDKLMISGAMQASSITTLVNECDSLGINTHSMSGNGAFSSPEL